MSVQLSRWPSISGYAPRCALTAVADYAEKTLDKRSIDDLLRMEQLSKQERVLQLHETLKVGLARCAMRLHEMPLGFCNAPSIKRVTNSYVENFRQVKEYEHRVGANGISHRDYRDLTRSIFDQHRGTMLDVAKGVFEFYEDLNLLFGEGLDIADMRDDLCLVRDIESSLDEFFTNRLTLRLLISHVHSLNGEVAGTDSSNQEMVGVVNVNTQPIAILNRAYVAARFMCLRDFQMAPDLLVNGQQYDKYMAEKAASAQHHFPYVHTHLFYIFLELVKNAARASIERAQFEAGDSRGKIEIPPMHVIVPEDQAMWEMERSVKLADGGAGMNRSVLSKAFSYFYSSVKARPTVATEVSDFDRRVPLAGFGFGLPISRVMARYFSGDIDLNSIPGKGTDAYIYL